MVLRGKVAHSRKYKAFHRQGVALGWRLSFLDTNEQEASFDYQSIYGKLMSYDYKEAGAFIASWRDQGIAFL